MHIHLLMNEIIENQTELKGFGFIRGLLSGIDEIDKNIANKCIDIAASSMMLKSHMIQVYTSIEISEERLNQIVEGLRLGIIDVSDCAQLSYGRGLDGLSADILILLIDELSVNHKTEGVWAALEIISMYQHGKSNVDKRLADKIEEIISSPDLLGEIRRATRDGYIFETLVKVIDKHYGIDDDFAKRLGGQIVRLCQLDDYKIFHELDAPFKKLVKLLVLKKPLILWRAISGLFEIATPIEMHRLTDLIGSSYIGFEQLDYLKEGAIFGVSDSEYIKWIDIDPASRAPFVCEFYPILDREKDELNWHPAIEKMSEKYGYIPAFREAIFRRLHPRSWSGSLVPYLERHLELLEKWFKSQKVS